MQKASKFISLVLLAVLLSAATAQHLGDVRLLDGSAPHEGRMELYLGGRGWYTTCDKHWNILDAIVICRQLGFPGAAFATLGTEFGRSTEKHQLARAWNCTGDERKIGQCHYEPTYSCNDMVGVICQGTGIIMGEMYTGIWNQLKERYVSEILNCQPPTIHNPSYLGCFTDERGIFESFLAEDYFVSSSLTVESCKKFCSDSSHPIIGLKDGRECYCGDTRDVISGHAKVSDAMCQDPCSGNERQICGGWRASDHDSISIFDVNFGDCEDPGVPENGERLSDWFHFGEVVKYYCNPGYELVGAGVIQCILTKHSNDGHVVNWNDSSPSCVEIPRSTTVTTPSLSTTPEQTTAKTSTPATIKTTTPVTMTTTRVTTIMTPRSTTFNESPDTTLDVVTVATPHDPKSITTPDSMLSATLANSSAKSGNTVPIPATTERLGHSTNTPTFTTPRSAKEPVTPSHFVTVKSTSRSALTSRDSSSSSDGPPSTADEVSDELHTEKDFTYYTDMFGNQTETVPEDNPNVPKNGLFGLTEDLTILVSVGAILIVSLLAVMLITITKKLLCRKRRAYHSINIERRLSEELNPGGPCVYEPLTESGRYSRPLRSSLRRGFRRLSRRPWSELEDDHDSDDEL